MLCALGIVRDPRSLAFFIASADDFAVVAFAGGFVAIVDFAIVDLTVGFIAVVVFTAE